MLCSLKSLPSSTVSAFVRNFAFADRTNKEFMKREEINLEDPKFKEVKKMTEGKNYEGWDDTVVRARERAYDLCNQINSLKPHQTEERQKLLSELLTYDEPTFYVQPPFNCDFGFNIHVGKNVYMNFNTVILDEAGVTIGDDTKFGPNCNILTATHPLDPKIRKQHIEYGKPIKVGKNCWIGGNVTLCPGVTIGDNTTIGAGAVVSKDIPANSVAVGNPAHVIKTFETDE